MLGRRGSNTYSGSSGVRGMEVQIAMSQGFHLKLHKDIAKTKDCHRKEDNGARAPDDIKENSGTS